MPSAARVLDLLINAIDEDVRAKDVEEPRSFEDFLPEVASAVPRGVLGIAGPTHDCTGVVAAVEGEKARRLAGEACRHMYLVRVGGKVD